MSLPVPLYGLAIEEEKRKTKKGDRFFWQVTLKTVVGNVKGFMWNAGPDASSDPKFIHAGDIVEVTDYQDQMEDRGTIVINAFRRMTKEDLPTNAKQIVEFDKASDEDIKWSLGLIGDSSFWTDKRHHSYVTACLRRLDKEKLRACPAATHVHHQYHGGLLVHTAEVLELCKVIAESCVRRYPFISKDVIYASAILHDIGKVETYSVNDFGVAKSLATEKIIGHLFYGMSLADSVARDNFEDGNSLGLSQDFINEVLHCIASHHGLVEWGSLKVVQSLEAGILSRADYISSRNGMVESTLKDAIKSGQPLQDTFSIYGDPYFASTGMRGYAKEL